MCTYIYIHTWYLHPGSLIPYEELVSILMNPAISMFDLDLAIFSSSVNCTQNGEQPNLKHFPVCKAVGFAGLRQKSACKDSMDIICPNPRDPT